MLKRALNICGELGSYSDSCSNILIIHFDALYDHMQNNFNADNICHLSGQCVSRYHKHDEDMVSMLIICIKFNKYRKSIEIYFIMVRSQKWK